MLAQAVPQFASTFMHISLHTQVPPLALAAVGIYGVMSYTVTQRTREMGIRLALGAQRASMIRLVISQAARLAAMEVGASLVGALALSRAVASLLYDMSAIDPLTYGT